MPFFNQEYKKEVAKCQHKGGGEGKGKPGTDTCCLEVEEMLNAHAAETRIALLI